MATARISWETTPVEEAAKILLERHAGSALGVARQNEERATGPASEYWVEVRRILERD